MIIFVGASLGIKFKPLMSANQREWIFKKIGKSTIWNVQPK
jgi:hypothetical protein